MKKINVIAILALFLLVISCTKEDVIVDANVFGVKVETVNSNIGVKSSEKLLHFEKRADYENVINYLSQGDESVMARFEDSLSFNSMRVMLSDDERECIGIYDDVLATILNKEGLIRIEDYIIHINTLNDSLEVYSAISNKKLMSLSVDQDFFSIIDGQLDLHYNDVTALGDCNKMNYVFSNLPSILDTKVKCTLVYQRAGIYFSILIKVDEPYQIGYSQLNKWVNIESGNYYTPKNRSTYYIPKEVTDIQKCHFHKRLYSGIRRLTSFSVDVICEVRYYIPGDPYGDSVVLHIQKS